RFRKTTFERSIVRYKFAQLLRQGHDVVVVSDLRYFDVKDEKDKNVIVQAGLESRLVAPLGAIDSALLSHLTIYASAGTYKVTFNQQGQAITNHDFNARTTMDETIAIQMKEVIEIIIAREYEDDYRVRPEYYREIYQAFSLEDHKPTVILHKNYGGIFGLSIINLPSKLVGAYNEARNLEGNDVREKIYAAIQEKLPQAIHPHIWGENQYTVGIRGFTSIDIRRHGTGKDHALRQHIIDNRVNPSDVFFFGNLDEHSEDMPLKLVSGIHRFSSSRTQHKNFRPLEVGLGSVYYWMDFIFKNVGKNGSTILREYEAAAHKYPSLVAALDYLKEFKNQGALRADHGERIEQLYQIYKNFNLTAVDAAAWTLLYQEAFESDVRTAEALNEFVLVYYNTGSAQDIFKAADEIYARYGNLDFATFYGAVDARAARNIHTLAEVYGSDEILTEKVWAASEHAKVSAARVLAGYYQDHYFLRYKESMFKTLKSRGPPKTSKVVYLGGGGKATTTLLQKLIAKGLTQLACIISSSDDGGSSKTIMMSLFNKFGFYFISAGDAAGLNIFLSNDNFKIFTLFWIEEQIKKLPVYIIDPVQEPEPVQDPESGRITATAVYPVWQRRVKNIISHFSNEQHLEEIRRGLVEGLKESNENFRISYSSERHLVFLTSLLSLGDLLDRELISRGIMDLKDEKIKKMSTANLLLIGDAYDSGILKFGRKVEENTEQFVLHHMLELKDAQPVPVTYNYEKSALIAYGVQGNLLETTQTRITDKAQEELISDIFFSHRTAEERMKKFESASDEAYPKTNPKVVELINRAEVIIMGNGSLWTSLMPVLLYRDVAEAIINKKAQGVPIVFIAKIKSDLETAAGVKVVKEYNNPTTEVEAEIVEIQDGKKEAKVTGISQDDINSKREYYLYVREQMILIDQLKAIQRHISRTLGLKETIPLNKLFSHVIIPGMAPEVIEKLKVVKLDAKKAIELAGSLKLGKAQISKYVEGIQPEITQADINYLKEEGLNVEVVSEDNIIGKEAGKPLYNNDYLYEVLKSIAPVAFEEASSPVKINDGFKALPKIATDFKLIRVSYDRPSEVFRQVMDIAIPVYDATDAAGLEVAARRLVIEVYNRLTIFGAVKVKVAVEEVLFNRFREIFMDPALSNLSAGRGYAALGSFMNIVYQTSEFGIERVEEGTFNGVESTQITTIESVNNEGSWLGLDIGGSDIKAVVVKDGQLVHHKIVKWSPKTMADPYAANGHIPAMKGILNDVIAEAVAEGFNSAELRAIGVSINLAVANNKVTGLGPVVESLRGKQAKVMSQLDVILNQEFNLPVYVLNDGDAAAIQTTIDMGLPNTVSLAGGTGLAMGYGSTQFLTEGGNIVIDTYDQAEGHSFSKVRGAAQQYISQRPVFRLAEKASIDLSMFEREADKLIHMQKLYEQGDERAVEVFKQMPKYLVEFINIVARILKVGNVVLFGRITKGEAGKFMKEEAQRQLDALGINVKIHFPRAPEGIDQEVYLEVGQAVGATYYAAHKISTSSSPINNPKDYERSFRKAFRVSKGKRLFSKADLNSVGRKDPNYPGAPFPHLTVFAFPQGVVLSQVANLQNQLQGALSQELKNKIRLLKREDLHMTVMGTKWDEDMIIPLAEMLEEQFNSTIPRPLGRGLPLKEEELEKPGGFSNSGFHIDTPPLEAGRFIGFVSYLKALVFRGRYPEVILSGGIGRATGFFAEKVRKYAKDRGMPAPDLSNLTEAEMMAIMLKHEGYPQDNVYLEKASRNSPENILFSKPIISNLMAEGKVTHNADIVVIQASVSLRRAKITAEQLLADVPLNVVAMRLFDKNFTDRAKDAEIVEDALRLLGNPYRDEEGELKIYDVYYPQEAQAIPADIRQAFGEAQAKFYQLLARHAEEGTLYGVNFKQRNKSSSPIRDVRLHSRQARVSCNPAVVWGGAYAMAGTFVAAAGVVYVVSKRLGVLGKEGVAEDLARKTNAPNAWELTLVPSSIHALLTSPKLPSVITRVKLALTDILTSLSDRVPTLTIVLFGRSLRLLKNQFSG
ncbi:MAG: ROK family protein, partial [Candidatus Omnitrophica bacterium]|nr:ROK family protein [Candidatus Omnitrophota bacterium]